MRVQPEPTALERKLAERVKRDGPITFRDFMQAALYDPDLGYYNRSVGIGPEGDYYTSSNVHPAFGAILARSFVSFETSSSEPWTIVEMGPGTGQLASDVLTSMREEFPSFFEHLSYQLVETSPLLKNLQREELRDFADYVQWTDLEDLQRNPVRGIVFSNEFVDALPVHRARYVNGKIEEQYVYAATPADAGQLLTLGWADPSSDLIQEHVKRIGVQIRDGQIVEVHLDAIDWLRRAACSLSEGLLITIDYGDTERLLYAPDRHSGTIRCFYRHKLVESPLEHVGEQDITASVNFTTLMDYGTEFKLDTVSYERQTAFLFRMGLIEMIAEKEQSVPTQEELKSRLALKNLFVPGGVSDNFRVMIQRKIR